MKEFRFEMDCMKCSQSMKTCAGNLDTGFVYKCPKCKTEICLTIILPPLQRIIQQIKNKKPKEAKK